MSIKEEQLTHPGEQTFVPPPVILHQSEPVKEQPPGRGRRWFVIALMIVFLLIGGIALFLANLPSGGSVVPISSQKTSTFTVGASCHYFGQNLGT